MKLRIRSLATKETVRIETPDSSSFLDLKTLIAGKLSSSSPSPSSSSIPPQSIILSLNRKDELISSSPHDSLQSLGLTSGDLIFYSLSPSSSQTLTLNATPEIPNSDTLPLPDPMDDSNLTLISDPYQETLIPNAVAETLIPTSTPPVEIPNSDTHHLPDPMEYSDLTLISDPPREFPDVNPGDGMEVEMEHSSMEKSPSVPYFLKRVMELEKEEVKGNLGILIVAVHAVFFESGFVVCSGNGSRLPKDWDSEVTRVSIQYTVPDLLGSIRERDVKFAILKFSVMGNYVSVYGYLSGDRPDVYRLCLDLSKFAPLLVSALNSVGGEKEKEVFNLWKIVKDGLCLPLLIDICQKNGLPPPPCFARLPTDLKIRVLELLPGVDVARVGCTSSELRYLTSNDDLWKEKFVEEFGLLNDRGGVAASSWKEKFKRCWVKRKDSNKRSEMVDIYGGPILFIPRHPLFMPQSFPMVGGDYDRFPAIGGLGPMGPGLGFPRLPARRKFSPPCNLGGYNANFIG